MVWLRLPGLPMEFWMSSLILAIVVEAGRLVATDNFTYLLWKIGYARVWVEIDAGKPMKPSVYGKGKKGIFW